MSETNAMTDLFGEVIHTYTRADAIRDGVLIDVTPTATEAGFRWPVAITAAAWHDTIRWTDDDEARKPAYTGQDENGRLWDCVYMAHRAITAAIRRGEPAGTRLAFQLMRVPATGRGLRPRLVTLALVTGPGDQGEPVVTLLLPHED